MPPGRRSHVAVSAPRGPSGTDAYRLAGVDYDTLDRAKRAAQAAALTTSDAPRRRGALVDDSTRGEPATLIEVGGALLAVVLECLGTKSLIAAAVEESGGDPHWDAVGYDTVAAAVNDCCCLGALPLAVNAYFAVGSSSFYDGARHAALVAGFRSACEDAGAAWTGGESPALGGVVEPAAIDLAASVLGRVPAGSRPWRGSDLRPGDEIVLVASSGLHTNGASLARHLAGELPQGYATPLPSGRSFGDALLEPSLLYAPLVEALIASKAEVHYASHITGHGLRKLMRAGGELTYRVCALPAPPEVLAFLAERSALAPPEAYGTLNMGVGFALFCATGAGSSVVARARSLGLSALAGGLVEEGPRRVVLEPVGVSYAGEELELRPARRPSDAAD
jgi:phosphoribosylformylglycinamidine cyclo-ligase